MIVHSAHQVHRTPLAGGESRGETAGNTARRPPFLEIGLACLVWAVYLQMPELSLAEGAWWESLQRWVTSPVVGEAETPGPSFARSALFALPLTLVWTLSVTRASGGHRLVWGSILVWLGFCGFSLFLGRVGAGSGGPIAHPWGQQAGAVLGIVTAGLLGSALRAGRPESRSPRLAQDSGRTWPLVALLLGGLWLLPLDPQAMLSDPRAAWDADSLGAYVRGLAPRLYYLYKGALLWVPIGLLVGVAGRERTLSMWLVGALVGFTLMAPSFHDYLRFRDLIEVGVIPLGVWSGLWMGRQVRRAADESARAVSPKAGQLESIGGAPPGPPPPSTPVQRPSPAAQDRVEPSSGDRARRPIPPAAGAASTRHEPRREASSGAAVRRLMQAASIGLLALVALSVVTFPRWPMWLGSGLALYAVVLWRYPAAWLVAVPAALPLLDLASWTGRFFLDEFDLAMAVTVAFAAWRGAWRGPGLDIPPPIKWLLAFFTAAYVVSLLKGVWPLPPLDANAFSSYWSPYNSLRVAKGVAWALVVFVLLRGELAVRARETHWRFALGMSVGLLGVAVMGIRERWLFSGLLDYRITSTFSSMHTGGSHVEAYLVAAIPFLCFWIAGGRRRLAALATGALFLLSAYAVALTVSRGGAMAFALVIVVLLSAGTRKMILSRRLAGVRMFSAALLALGGLGVVVAAMQQPYFHARLSAVDIDSQIRLHHWRKAFELMDDDLGTQAFGMGLGRFPERYLLDSILSGATPGTYRYDREGDNVFLRLGGGESMRMGQRVAVRSTRNYRLSLRVRSADPRAQLTVSLCERQVLQDFRCQHRRVDIEPSTEEWDTRELTLRSGVLGRGSVLTRRPVEILFSNPLEGSVVDLDDVRLAEARGENLIGNGDFSRGGDDWFFATEAHLPWHVKNLWFAVLFEQGWVGLLLFNLLVGFVIAELARAVWRGDGFSAILLASLMGFLAVGLFGSLFDAPRLATLFWGLLLYGALTVGRPPAPP